eukprot:7568101-Heterocapsa_arctica.AAC.1
MVAILGRMFQGGTLGTTGPHVWLPGSTVESELGVQAPVGCWDPVGSPDTIVSSVHAGGDADSGGET